MNEAVTHERYLIKEESGKYSMANYVDEDGGKYHVPIHSVKFGPKRYVDEDGNELLDQLGRPLKSIDRGYSTNIHIGGAEADRERIRKFKAESFKKLRTRENRAVRAHNLDKQLDNMGFERVKKKGK